MVYPLICWDKMGEGEIVIRLDETEPASTYRVRLGDGPWGEPNDEGLFIFSGVAPGQLYDITCEVMNEDGVWEEACPVVTMNYIGPVKVPSPFGPRYLHRSGGKPANLKREVQARNGDD